MEDNWAIRADDGDISLVLPDDFAADLRLSSDDGPIEVEPPVAVPGRVSRHRLSGQLNGGGPELRVRSDDGTSPSGERLDPSPARQRRSGSPPLIRPTLRCSSFDNLKLFVYFSFR
jgi:hypothetical protein